MSLRTSEQTNYENCNRPKIKIKEEQLDDRPSNVPGKSGDHPSHLNQTHSKPLRIGKMLLPNDGPTCFQSFHDRLILQDPQPFGDPKDDASHDCFRSLDIRTLANRKQNVINLNHNLITLNNSLFINDPLNDSLQWCLEPAYQR